MFDFNQTFPGSDVFLSFSSYLVFLASLSNMESESVEKLDPTCMGSGWV